MPAKPSPRTPSMLGVLAFHLAAVSHAPCGRGYIVPAASHGAVASAACAGRLLVMEHEVPLTFCSVGTITQTTSCRTNDFVNRHSVLLSNGAGAWSARSDSC